MEGNKQIVRDALASFGEGDYEGFLSLFSDDCVFTLGGNLFDVTKVEGKAAFRELLQFGFSGDPENGYNGLVGPIRFEIEMLLTDGNRVIDISRGFSHTTEGDREYNNSYCRIWEIEQGRVVSMIEFLDTAHFNRTVLQSET